MDDQGNSRAASGGVTRREVMASVMPGVASGVVLAACVPGGNSSAEPPGLGKEPVTIRWSTWGDQNNPFNTQAVPRGLQLFTQKFPNVKVEPEVQLEPDWPQKLRTEWIAGTGVDLTGHCCQHSIAFSREGFLLNMDPYLKRDAKAVPTEDYVEWLMKLFNSKENGQFALPMYTGTIALMFNRRRFQEKGVPLPDDTWDWAKYRDMGLRIADPDAKRWARADVGPNSMYRRFHQIGANAVDPKDDRVAAFTSAKAIEALEWERNQIHRDRTVVQTLGPKAPPETGPDSQTHFVQINSGYISMWEGGAFTLARYVAMLSDEVDWDAVPLPKGPAGRFTLATNDGWSISKATKAKDATWEFLKFLQSDEWTDLATRHASQQSARKSHQQRWLTAVKESSPKLANKNLKAFTEGIEKGYARPIEFWRKDVEAKRIFNEAYNKSVRDGDEEVGIAFRAAAEQINQINKV